MSESILTPQPLCLMVPLGDLKETDLMAALDYVIDHFWLQARTEETDDEITRAVNWLHAKHGTPR